MMLVKLSFVLRVQKKNLKEISDK